MVRIFAAAALLVVLACPAEAHGTAPLCVDQRLDDGRIGEVVRLHQHLPLSLADFASDDRRVVTPGREAQILKADGLTRQRRQWGEQGEGE